MKRLLTLFVLSLVIIACNDKLTVSKAKNILQDCLLVKPDIGKVYFNTGNIRFYTSRESDMNYLSSLKNLEQEGYLTISPVETRNRYNQEIYNISLTKKAADYVLETRNNRATVKTFEYKVGDVKEIFEVPHLNQAKVTAIYMKAQKTPFFELENDKSEFKTINLTFRKTNQGWRQCQ